MKRPALANDKTAGFYGSRSYVSASPKTALATYYKSANFALNSPKNELPNGLTTSPKQNNISLRASSQVDRAGVGFERKGSKRDDQGYSTASSSKSNYFGLAGSSTKLRGTSTRNTNDKAKVEYDGVLGLNSKIYTGLSSGVSNSALKASNKKNMEISTDIQTFKTTGGLRAYSTKNRDEPKSGLAGRYASNITLDTGKYQQYNNQYQSPYNDNSNMRTDAYENKDNASPSKQRTALNRILSNTSDKMQTNKRTPQTGERVYQSQDNMKVNNFFSNMKRKELESTLAKKDKSMNVGTGYDYDDASAKKAVNRSQIDNRYGYNANQRGRDQADDQYYGASNLSHDANIEPKSGNTPASSSKVSLNSFITKVDKGSALPIRPRREEESNEISSSKIIKRPVQPVEDTSKGRTITFSKNKLNQQALATSSQEQSQQMVLRNGRISGGSTPLHKDLSESNAEAVTPVKRSSIIYYTQGMVNYHRSKKDSDYFSQIYREHLIQSFQALSFCKFLRNPDNRILQQKRVNLQKKPGYKDKKAVIFDLDETLVHCNESAEVPSDVILPIKFPHGEIIDAGINIRPYALECLKEVSQHYEVIIFTASHSCYANVVLDHLDPHGQYIHHRLFRESCVVTDEGVYVKDLRILGNRDMKDMVLVDNASYSFGYQIENGIPIIPYYDNKQDDELKHLTDYLVSIADVRDMREANKQHFKLHLYTKYDTVEKVINNVILKQY